MKGGYFIICFSFLKDPPEQLDCMLLYILYFFLVIANNEVLSWQNTKPSGVQKLGTSWYLRSNIMSVEGKSQSAGGSLITNT